MKKASQFLILLTVMLVGIIWYIALPGKSLFGNTIEFFSFRFLLMNILALNAIVCSIIQIKKDNRIIKRPI